MGGAAFPTSVKLSPPPEQRIHTLVVNGAECEPLLHKDAVVMERSAAEVVRGVVTKDGGFWSRRRGAEQEGDASDIETLRSLPYVAGSQAPTAETGVTVHDPSVGSVGTHPAPGSRHSTQR